MSRQSMERRRYVIDAKKKDPFGWKMKFLREQAFRRFRDRANSILNDCGWQFAEGSKEHKIWKLHHCDLEELERIYYYKRSEYEKANGRNNFKPTPELKEMFLWYLRRAYDLYNQIVALDYRFSGGEKAYIMAWFKKTFNKLDPPPAKKKEEKVERTESVEEQSVAEEQTPATVNKEDEDKEFFKAVLDELFDDDKTTVVDAHLNPEREIRVGTLVRWPEYPDRLYFVLKTDVSHCGHDNYCVIETIDHKHKSVVPITDLVWDDVDYIEVERKIE